MVKVVGAGEAKGRNSLGLPCWWQEHKSEWSFSVASSGTSVGVRLEIKQIGIESALQCWMPGSQMEAKHTSPQCPLLHRDECQRKKNNECTNASDTKRRPTFKLILEWYECTLGISTCKSHSQRKIWPSGKCHVVRREGTRQIHKSWLNAPGQTG